MKRLAVLLVVVATLAACGVTQGNGIELGHLRDLARRVEGGGAECPLALADSLIRPSTVDPESPVTPRREGGPAADGVIGKGLPTHNSVKITCRYDVGGLAVTLVVVGVEKGRAIASFGDVLSKRATTSAVLTFIDANATLPVGGFGSLPGTTPGAFTRVHAASGDVALVVIVERPQGDTPLPGDAEVGRMAVAIARSLNN